MKTWAQSAAGALKLAVVVLSMVAAPSAACSVASTYVRPTNFELVQLADAIVIATATEEIGAGPDRAVRFRVDQPVKGSPPVTLVSQRAALGETVPSSDDLAVSHPEGHAGPCNRVTFAKGRQYVLFLKKQPGGELVEADYPFSRINEDYGGETSLWVRTIRTYLGIQQQLEPMAQLAALERLMGELRKAPDTPDRAAQARDILDHLMSRSPYKPTAYLVTTYETLERGEAPRYPLRSRAADEEQSDAQAMTKLLFGVPSDNDTASREEQKLFVLSSLVTGEHPAALPLFERLLSAPRLASKHLGLAMRFLAKNGHYARALALIETRALPMLPLLPKSEVGSLIGSIATVQSGEDYEDGKERWRSDPHARAVWPEMALSLYWYQVDTLGEGNTIRFDAINALKTADFRARPLVTLALAGDFDPDVEAWAIAELADEQKRRAWEAAEPDADDDPADLPLQALVRGYGEDRDAALVRAFCQGERRRDLLIRALGKWGNRLDADLAERMAASPQLTADERDLLAMAVAQIYARNSRFAGASGWLFDQGGDEFELLQKIIRRDKLKAAPIRCEPARR